MKQLKDRKLIEARIKIWTWRKVFKEGNCTSLKPNLICAEIGDSYSNVSTCFPDNKIGRKGLLKFIREKVGL